MAYFIVIGTGNEVKSVVDEIKTAHLQHNVITSGCILNEKDGLYYEWDIYNQQGEKGKSSDKNEPVILKDALTNQISHFRTLLPNDNIPNIFIISQYLNEDTFGRLKILCENLYKIGGAQLSGLLVDIILLGYDLSKADDVTIRPSWQILKHIEDITANKRFTTNILYINNMDYLGAATSVDTKILSKFLCNWSKIVCSASPNPKSTVRSKVYAIGMSEHQYDFRDLNEFFHLSAEERLLDRKLNHAPSVDTQELISKNYYKELDLYLPWIDGLKHIKSIWSPYCETELDTSIPISQNPYSLARHEYELALYLNSFLKLYIQEERREIAKLQNELEANEQEKNNTELIDVTEIDNNIVNIKAEITKHKENIASNSFIEGGDKDHVERIINYLRSEKAVEFMRSAVERATVNDTLPFPYPSITVKDLGHLKGPDSSTPSTSLPDDLSARPGCFGWIKRLLKTKNTKGVISDNSTTISEAVKEELNKALNECIEKFKEAKGIRNWWINLCNEIEDCEKRMAECKTSMDGEIDINGRYVKGKEGYKPPYHRKSISIINMDLVRQFRDNDEYYAIMIEKFLTRWFDKSIPLSERMTMRQLSKHQVLDPLVGRFHTLKWDGSNPFVNEAISDNELHSYIEHDIKESKPFVEYVRIKNTNISATLNTAFVFNNKNITKDPVKFRSQYILSDNAIVPIEFSDFVNSLCVVQILDIQNHIDDLEDFKPKREAFIHELRTDIDIVPIVGDAENLVDRARAIYDWICENIAYDTMHQVHDAESCWKMKRGLCSAYCELYCHLAEMVGLTAEIITGKVKYPDGSLSDKKHSWIFVYTERYDGILMDPTWGAGYVENGMFIKNTDHSTWFDVSPYWLVFSHFPDEPNWTKLSVEISEEQFRKLPYKQPSNEDDGSKILFERINNL